MIANMGIAVSGNTRPGDGDFYSKMQVVSSAFYGASLFIQPTTANSVSRLRVYRSRYPDIQDECLGPPNSTNTNMLWFNQMMSWQDGAPFPHPGTLNNLGPLWVRANWGSHPSMYANIPENTWVNTTGYSSASLEFSFYVDGVGSTDMYLDLTYDSTFSVYERHQIAFANIA